MRPATAARVLAALVALGLLTPAASFTMGPPASGMAVSQQQADGTHACPGDAPTRCVSPVDLAGVALLWVAGVLGLVGSITTERRAWIAGAVLLGAGTAAAAGSPWWMGAPPFQAYAIAIILSTAAAAFVLAAALHPPRLGREAAPPTPFT